MLELHAAIAEMYLKSYHGLFSNVKNTNKMGENLSFHIWEYLLNSLYILNEPYVRVNMFKRPKIGLKNFGEQIHHISLSFIFKGYVLCLLPAAFVSFQQSVKHQYLRI